MPTAKLGMQPMGLLGGSNPWPWPFGLDRECMSQRCASVLTPVLPIAHKTTTFLLKLAVWACVFVFVAGPVCK